MHKSDSFPEAEWKSWENTDIKINSSVVGCFRKLGVVGCVPYGTQGFLSSLGESSGLFLNKMDRVLSDVSLDTKMEVRYVQYD